MMKQVAVGGGGRCSVAALCIVSAFLRTAAPTDIRTGLESVPVAELLPAAVAWYGRLEQRFLPQGRALTESERGLAVALGVGDPGKVRVVAVERFPLPGDPELRAEAERHGLGGCRYLGLTVGHAIS